MSAQRLSFAYEGRIFSPFTGAPAETQDGPNEKDASLLFVYYGNAGYGYVSKRLKDAVTGDVEDMEPTELAARSNLPAAIVLEVDAGWNGTNYYGFAPI